MLWFFAGFFIGGFVVWWLARRNIRFSNAQRVGAEKMRHQLVDFCDKNGIVIKPWDIPPFSVNDDA